MEPDESRVAGSIFAAPLTVAANGVGWKYERAPGDWVKLNELRK
jgi:hypothetical protein